MKEQPAVNKALIATIIIAIIGWCTTYGITTNKVYANAESIERVERKHDADVEALQNRQAITDALLQSINNNLTELNTKVSLLLDGKIKAEY